MRLRTQRVLPTVAHSGRRSIRPLPPGARDERGTVLALIPAAFLVLMLLGALATDSGATFLGQRQLQAMSEAAANDAAAGAVSDSVFYSTGRVQIDPARAAAIVCADFAAQADGNLRATNVALLVGGASLLVRANALVPAVFGRWVPGLALRPVSARAGATAEQAPGTGPSTAWTTSPAAAFETLHC